MNADLATLHQEMRACRRCAEAGFAITEGAVFAGVSTAKVMLIGQAPGITEVTAKRPFNAGSGRRLFQWLEAAGWQEAQFRAQEYMTAVTKCYPGKGSNGKGDRVPSKAEQALCRPFLERERALIQPRLLILVGGLAIKLIYPASAKLEEIIGTGLYFAPEETAGETITEWVERPGNGRWVVPLPHPSGASLWPNRPENQARIQQAIALLSQIRLQLDPN